MRALKRVKVLHSLEYTGTVVRIVLALDYHPDLIQVRIHSCGKNYDLRRQPRDITTELSGHQQARLL